MISEEDAKIKVTQGRGMDLLRLEVVCVCPQARTCACAHMALAGARVIPHL